MKKKENSKSLQSPTDGVQQNPGPTEESTTEQSTAHSGGKGRPKGPAALFSRNEIADIIREASKLQDNRELVKWAKEKSLVWLVVLDKLLFKAKGPTAVSQTSGAIDKLIKHTEVMLRMPSNESVQRPPSDEDSEPEVTEQRGDDSKELGALLEEASEFFAGE